MATPVDVTGEKKSIDVRTNVGSRTQIALGVVMAVIYMLAIGAQQDQIALGVIVFSAVLAVVRPAAGLAMFALVMPMHEGEILAPIRFNAIMAGAIALGCIIRLPIDRPHLKVHPGVVLLLGYLAISALSILPPLSGHPQAWTPSAFNILLRLSTGAALFLSASYLFMVMSPRAFLGLALIGATIAALLGIGDILEFMPLDFLTYGLVDDAASPRASGGFSDPNFFGIYMATAAVLALGGFALAPRRLKLLIVPVIILLLAGVILSYSRTAFIGMLAGIVVLVGIKSRVAGLTLLIVAGLSATILYPVFLEARQGAILTPIDFNNMAAGEETRSTIAAAALSMFAAFPVFGVGFGVFQSVSLSYVVGGAPDSGYSHNQYLNILAEQGVVGVLLVGAIVVMLALSLIRSRSPFRPSALAIGATFLAASLFLHTATVFQSSSLIWLVMAAALAQGPRRTIQSMET